MTPWLLATDTNIIHERNSLVEVLHDCNSLKENEPITKKAVISINLTNELHRVKERVKSSNRQVSELQARKDAK